MSWRSKLREMLLAGGTLAAVGCGGGSAVNIQCGNANPDPCICGRPDNNSIERALCDQKQHCEGQGGVWSGGIYAQDGAVGSTCALPNADASVDGAAR